MYSQFSNIEIVGMATTVPDHIVRNIDYADVFGEEEVKKQIKVTGIKERHCIKGCQTATDLTIHSAIKLMEDIEWKGEDIDVLIYVSAYESFAIPSTAYFIQKKLNIGAKCLAFDMNLGCSAFVNGLYAVSALLQQMGEGAKGLLLVSDTTTVGGDHADKAVSMLSGDCGTATAIQLQANHKVLFQQRFDGSRYSSLVRKDLEHNLQMDGMAVFQFTISTVAESINEFFDYYKIDREEFDYFILHQAQKFIVDKVSFFSSLSKEKCLKSYENFGNTGGPSLPCTLCVNKETVGEKDKVKLFFAGFGAGLAWAMVTAEMKTEHILPVYNFDGHYDLF